MSHRELAVGMKVFDLWWSAERRGVVTKKSTRSLIVRWLDKTEWRYDREHCQFLMKVK